MPNLVVDFKDLPNMAGTDLGTSDYREITQVDIDTFANLTGDRQWIHVDPERAQESPLGATIAHGFFILSLIIPLWSELFDVEGVTTKLNYGLDKVRFTSPVKVGSKVRLRAAITDVSAVEGGATIKVKAIIEVKDIERPAAVAQLLARFYV
ncbi:MaoC family dehydratase [Arthrobacter sp. fls2-241-R2A-172]|uniref:MaoC family dehydratase n=1 Tax=Arthrobacter sp. fls2-241-R2A-172 TaxID=3040325 RepID=UPI00254EBAF6|nr:MaoC family dehydratase [Arthrobacter sp. fls2-241-R2A-172]